MSKRRRERDRPSSNTSVTASSTATADHGRFKRTLLTYESDREDEEEGPIIPPPQQSDGNFVTISEDNVPADYQIQPYSEDDASEEHADDPGYAAPRSARSAEISELQEGKGRAEKNEASKQSNRRNESTGQFAAIGSLAFQYDDDEDFDEVSSAEEEAMAYLRAVRSERQSLPTFLTAPAISEHAELYESGIGDTRGYWEDGAYIARPNIGPSVPETEKTLQEPQDAYTLALKDRFVTLRQQLQASPNPDAVSSLDEYRPQRFGIDKQTWARWYVLFQSAPPVTVQLQSLHQDTVFDLLNMLQHHFLQLGRMISSETSAWIWSLLARLDDVGSLSSDHVYAVREFAKRAILVQTSFDYPEAAEELERAAAAEREEASVHISKGTAAVIKSLHERMGKGNAIRFANEDSTDEQTSASSGDVVPEKPDPERIVNTKATLDAIISLAGEVFGQRDLLEFRQSWTPEEPSDGSG